MTRDRFGEERTEVAERAAPMELPLPDQRTRNLEHIRELRRQLATMKPPAPIPNPKEDDDAEQAETVQPET